MFGMRAWPTPFLRPMWPFMVGAGMTFYLVNAAQNAMLQSDEFKNSPKNPHRISSTPAAH
ncbi:RHTO0S34e00496g1_1 [Rhodotorula toruloides]|uniref:RHTO0S34e00496g1_1 n=2 Tax=Rhodotorula toruloides TaxID=5286 RepID=A0A061BIK2_RHOTO|nr:F-type H+-transporting ATPase subunit j [Rhodotorula toruloides NP11]EMS18092.1 F-type H+-transporting ATPase subunit j [Rhodotorula toruloides NP11]CDR49814.1 RHTO0S34e00496g1_1 [Rhodotorula toruloides]